MAKVIGRSRKFDVGQKVRVSTEDYTSKPFRACRGVVLCVSEPSDKVSPSYFYDILLVGITDDEEQELSAVKEEDIVPLKDFETDGSLDTDHMAEQYARSAEELVHFAEDLKEKGNVLFKLGDIHAAAEIFNGVLGVVEPQPRIGTTVLIRNTGTEPVSFRPGMISDAGDGVFDVILDHSDNQEEDEENDVSSERVVVVSNTAPSTACAARLNLARCRFKICKHLEVIEACTVVIALARLLLLDKGRAREERLKLRAHCMTAFRVRGSSHLAQNHIGLARKDARNMMRAAGSDEDSRKQAGRFEAEVERKAHDLSKANRKLARDVTRWVDASMARHAEASTGLEGSGFVDQDDGIAETRTTGTRPSESTPNEGARNGREGQVEAGENRSGVMSWLGWR